MSALAQKTPILIHASTAHNADLLYLGKFDAPDAFTAFKIGNKRIALLNALEFGRGKKQSAYTTLLPLEVWRKRAAERGPSAYKKNPEAATIATVAAHYKTKRFRVPASFPAALYNELTALGVSLSTEDLLFPERLIKTDQEAAFIRQGNKAAANGIAAAETVLRESKIKKGLLYYKGRVLTSEHLKTVIEIACLEAGALSVGTIATGGDQACDPHETGHGPLRANQLIVLDVFPRVMKTAYHGDMTRTFLRGKASEAQHRLVETVRNAQKAALSKIRAGVDGKAVHETVHDFFEQNGYQTRITKKGAVGFFHGTGHGLGLDIHEAPRVSSVSNILEAGTVVTVEPGLYYPGLGGCRIEDVVQVTDKRPKMLSSYHYNWIL